MTTINKGIFMAKSKKLKKGPKGSGIDPLTTGEKTHGENIKEASEKHRAAQAKINLDAKYNARFGTKAPKSEEKKSTSKK